MAAQLGAQTAKVGPVDVDVTPLRLNGGGAAFKIKFDTHVGALDMDLPKGAHLSVGGTPWPSASWQGGGPSGHHREGTLGFDPGGPAAGRVTLSIDGLPAPLEVSWTLPAAS